MIIDCISDLHGAYPNLQGGDLLIIAGDMTERDLVAEWKLFYQWLKKQDYLKKVIIGGNHDNILQHRISDELYDTQFKQFFEFEDRFYDYLCDSEIIFCGLSIWGAPWTRWFRGVNPKCKAFMLNSDKEMKKHWDLIPEDVDILITHTPPLNILDDINDESRRVGCPELRNLLISGKIKPKLHVFGHLHESYGQITDIPECPETIFVNAAHMNQKYIPTNLPIRIEL